MAGRALRQRNQVNYSENSAFDFDSHQESARTKMGLLQGGSALRGAPLGDLNGRQQQHSSTGGNVKKGQRGSGEKPSGYASHHDNR